jgi:hypothetical protein
MTPTTMRYIPVLERNRERHMKDEVASVIRGEKNGRGDSRLRGKGCRRSDLCDCAPSGEDERKLNHGGRRRKPSSVAE